jgi:hypothetical protein
MLVTVRLFLCKGEATGNENIPTIDNTENFKSKTQIGKRSRGIVKTEADVI